MGTIYTRGRRIWARYKDGVGSWKSAKTPYVVGQEEKAQRWVEQVERNLSSNVTARLSGGKSPAVA